MSVVQVGIVPVTVHGGRVPMPVTVGFAGRIVGAVLMLVLRVVPVPVLVRHGFMRVFVLVQFGQV